MNKRIQYEGMHLDMLPTIAKAILMTIVMLLGLGISISYAQESGEDAAGVMPNLESSGLPGPPGFETQSIRISELEPLPGDSKYDQIITFNTGLGGASLPVMIEALAHSVGLTAVIEDVPNKQVTYNLGKKPFRQIWQILISLNGLDYQLLSNDVIIVGSVDTISRFNEREPKPEVVEVPVQPVVQEPEPVLEQRFYKVSGDPTELAGALQTVAPDAAIAPFATIQTISVRASALEHNAVATALREIDIVKEEPKEEIVEVEPVVEPIVEPEPDPEPIIIYAETEQRVYRLSNAVAEEVAAILQLSTESQTPEVDTQAQAEVGIAIPDGASLKTLEDGTKLITPKVSVVADQRTNSLIIQATAEQHNTFGGLLPQLDIAQKQVNVQVRIQEIKKSTVNSLGIDLSGGFGNFSATLLDTGLNFVFDAQRAISGLNIGAVLDTYETQGLSRRVDDTNLTVLDNGEGTMQSGGVITVVDRSNNGGDGGDVKSLEIPYGVQVTVKPRVGNDGRITMTVQAKVEDLLSPLDSTDIQRSTNSVESLISLEPGQTVLLGGLFQNKFKENIKGTPILSSIPVIGSAFSTTTIEEDESELLLIVTANVID